MILSAEPISRTDNKLFGSVVPVWVVEIPRHAPVVMYETSHDILYRLASQKNTFSLFAYNAAYPQRRLPYLAHVLSPAGEMYTFLSAYEALNYHGYDYIGPRASEAFETVIQFLDMSSDK